MGIARAGFGANYILLRITVFVKAKVALEELDDGQILSIRLNDGEPVQNVPRSIKEEGHEVLSFTENGDETYTLIVKKVGD